MRRSAWRARRARGGSRGRRRLAPSQQGTWPALRGAPSSSSCRRLSAKDGRRRCCALGVVRGRPRRPPAIRAREPDGCRPCLVAQRRPERGGCRADFGAPDRLGQGGRARCVPAPLQRFAVFLPGVLQSDDQERLFVVGAGCAASGRRTPSST